MLAMHADEQTTLVAEISQSRMCLLSLHCTLDVDASLAFHVQSLSSTASVEHSSTAMCEMLRRLGQWVSFLP
jgi:hypothetical protein